MHEMKHTPGPWTLSDGGFYVRAAIYHNPKDGTCPAICCSLEWGEGRHPAYTMLRKENALANARLIAAAPDLFAALKAVEWEGGNATCPQCGEAVTDRHAPGCLLAAAIAKAKGVSR